MVAAYRSQLQSLHVAQAVVQLLGRERARHQADPRLSGEAALRAVAELPGRRLLQRRQRQPGVDATGSTLQGGTVVPAVTQRSIGDVLTAKNIPWKYYGGGYNASGVGNPINGITATSAIRSSIRLNYPAMRADHMRDVTDLFVDLKNGTLPAVSYVKPDGAMDGHPASSKFNLFEAFVDNIITLAQANTEQWEETAIFVTVDEGGGYYDSGFIQPVDFFGTGPRIPMIAVSPFSRGGHISHVYNEHSSFVKFVERNWKLHTTLTARSRDNLPNPKQDADGDPTTTYRATCRRSATCSTCSTSTGRRRR